MPPTVSVGGLARAARDRAQAPAQLTLRLGAVGGVAPGL